MSKKVLLLSMFGLMLSVSLFAKPDVGSTDSGNYNGAHLKHQLVGDNVKFVLSGPILNYRLPDKFYNEDALKSFIQKRQFANADLKSEFLEMLEMGFNSQFKAKEFLDELVKVLDVFER